MHIRGTRQPRVDRKQSRTGRCQPRTTHWSQYLNLTYPVVLLCVILRPTGPARESDARRIPAAHTGAIHPELYTRHATCLHAAAW